MPPLSASARGVTVSVDVKRRADRDVSPNRENRRGSSKSSKLKRRTSISSSAPIASTSRAVALPAGGRSAASSSAPSRMKPIVIDDTEDEEEQASDDEDQEPVVERTRRALREARQARYEGPAGNAQAGGSRSGQRTGNPDARTTTATATITSKRRKARSSTNDRDAFVEGSEDEDSSDNGAGGSRAVTRAATTASRAPRDSLSLLRGHIERVTSEDREDDSDEDSVSIQRIVRDRSTRATVAGPSRRVNRGEPIDIDVSRDGSGSVHVVLADPIRSSKGKQRDSDSRNKSETVKDVKRAKDAAGSKRKRDGGFAGTLLGGAASESSDVEVVANEHKRKKSPKKAKATSSDSDDLEPLNLDDVLDCPICFEMFISPVNLTCGHMFCHACVEPWLATNAKACPTCREVTTADPARAYFAETVIKKYFNHALLKMEKEGRNAEAKKARSDRTRLEADAEKRRLAAAAHETRRRAEVARIAQLQQLQQQRLQYVPARAIAAAGMGMFGGGMPAGGIDMVIAMLTPQQRNAYTQQAGQAGMNLRDYMQAMF